MEDDRDFMRGLVGVAQRALQRAESGCPMPPQAVRLLRELITSLQEALLLQYLQKVQEGEDHG